MKKLFTKITGILIFCILNGSFGMAQQLTVPHTSGCLNDTAFVPVNYSNIDSLGALTVYITYDTSVLTFAGFGNADTLLPGLMCGVPASGPNAWQVVISWVGDPLDSAGIDLIAGKLCDIKFIYKGGNSDLDFLLTSELVKPDLAVISMSYTDGSISPTIVSQPASSTICENGQTDFFVTAFAGSTFQWQVLNGSLWEDLQNDATYAGVYTDSLHILQAHYSLNNKTYRCAVSVNCTQFSDTALLTVHPKPVIVINNDTTICAGDSVVLDATGTSGSLPLQYFWDQGLGSGISHTVFPATTTIYHLAVTDTFGCSAFDSVMVAVIQSPAPAGIITGDSAVCPGQNNVYYSVPDINNATAYLWSYSGTGVTISGSTNPVTIDFSDTATSGVLTVMGVNSCGNGTISGDFPVIVNSRPVPAITGPDSVCYGSTGVVYSTEAGMTGYSWIISAGGSITSGVGTNSVQVTWNTAGPQTISVNYTDGNGCTAATATIYNVMVNTLPGPVITGTDSVCNGSTGVAYSTEAGMTGYSWIISAGGSITSGAGTNSILVTWNTAGPQTISVNYADGNGCTAATATTYNVMVNTLPVPVITGADSVCNGSTGVVYSTEAGMTGYSWIISAGGSITSGAGTNSVLVTWNTAGPQTISVNYTDGNGCTAAAATIYNIVVNTLPVPVITGPDSVCNGSTGVVYSTEAGMTGYSWIISAGGSITSGAGTDSVLVTWNTAGPQTISVNYTDGNGCTAATATIYNVMVNTLPVPAITGPDSVCSGSTGVVYSTETGMTGYSWIISAGGSITSGAGTNSVLVTWNTAGPQTISVNYTDGNGCTAATATIYNVMVNTLPVPVITGADSVCNGSTGVAYSTEAGMTGYSWIISAGGSITSGAGTNSILVTWNTAGPQTISVNYTDGNGCTAATATTYGVMVNTLPVPVITGADSVCIGSTGVVYSTETGMTGYSWTISAGGSITSGAGTNSVLVTWNTAGPQTISVNYTDGNGCTAAAATIYNIVVNTLPVPVITGPDSVCSGSTGVVYSTETGMTGYSWSISSGGSITSGAGTDSVLVTWNTAGPQTISINYTDGNGCTAATATTYNVMVNTLPVPVITGADSVCIGSTGVAYSTEAGMTGYSWIISAGGSITSGAGTNSILVTWNTAGPQTISVNYADGNGCTAAAATTFNVMVNTLPVPVITGADSVCNGSANVVYSTVAGMTGYSWSISTGGSITSGAGTNSVLVTWNTAGPQTISVNYTDGNGCTAAAATIYNIVVNTLPVPVITGPDSVCSGSTGVVYSTETGMTGYSWSISTGGSITSGAGTNSVLVTWNTAGPQTISVNYTDDNGCTAATATTHSVMVNTLPVPVITGLASVCNGSSDVVYSTETGMTGYSWSISAGGSITSGAGTDSVLVTWNTAGNQTISVNYTDGNGCTASTATGLAVTVHQIPVAEAGPDTTYISTPVQIGDPSTGPGTISWLPAAGLSDPAIAQPLASPSVTTIYTLTVSNYGCTASDVVTVAYGGVSYTISGRTYYAGRAFTGNPVPNQPTYNAAVYNIDNVIVIVKNYSTQNEVARDTSDALGNFQIPGIIDGNYLISYDKYTPDTMLMGNGMDVIDLTILKYFITSDTTVDPSRCFSEKYKKAADIDNNYNINAIDIARLKTKIGSPYDPDKNFPKGNWRALDTTLTISGNDLNINLKTICYGDYNASSRKYRDSLNNWSGVKSLPPDIIVTSDEYVAISDPSYFEVPLRIGTKMNEFSAMGLELTYPADDFRLVSVSMPPTGNKNGSVKINPAWDEILADDNDLMVTDNDGVIRVIYATTSYFDVEANDEIVRLGFRPLRDVPAGELDFELTGTGVIGNQYGEENDEAYLFMPRIFVNGNNTPAGFDFAGYPNPFSRDASFTYTIPENGTVKIDVYNVLGELVSGLVNEVQAGGKHSVVFSPEGLSSGIYTVKLEYTGSSHSESLMLKMVH